MLTLLLASDTTTEPPAAADRVTVQLAEPGPVTIDGAQVKPPSCTTGANVNGADTLDPLKLAVTFTD